MLILPNITTLLQYIERIRQEPCLYDEMRCPNCRCATLWKHGGYHRKPDRTSSANESLNPVLIQRFLCVSCNKTCSVLPECIPPRRWYLWDIQQAALLLYCAGHSLNAIAAQLLPDRHTISRWIQRFQQRFLPHESVLRNRTADLGRVYGFKAFWQACLNKCSLAEAMRFCHVDGVSIP